MMPRKIILYCIGLVVVVSATFWWVARPEVAVMDAKLQARGMTFAAIDTEIRNQLDQQVLRTTVRVLDLGRQSNHFNFVELFHALCGETLTNLHKFGDGDLIPDDVFRIEFGFKYTTPSGGGDEFEEFFPVPVRSGACPARNDMQFEYLAQPFPITYWDLMGLDVEDPGMVVATFARNELEKPNDGHSFPFLAACQSILEDRYPKILARLETTDVEHIQIKNLRAKSFLFLSAQAWTSWVFPVVGGQCGAGRQVTA